MATKRGFPPFVPSRSERRLEGKEKESAVWCEGTFEEKGWSNFFLCESPGLLLSAASVSLASWQALGSR